MNKTFHEVIAIRLTLSCSVFFLAIILCSLTASADIIDDCTPHNTQWFPDGPACCTETPAGETGHVAKFKASCEGYYGQYKSGYCFIGITQSYEQDLCGLGSCDLNAGTGWCGRFGRCKRNGDGSFTYTPIPYGEINNGCGSGKACYNGECRDCTDIWGDPIEYEDPMVGNPNQCEDNKDNDCNGYSDWDDSDGRPGDSASCNFDFYNHYSAPPYSFGVSDTTPNAGSTIEFNCSYAHNLGSSPWWDGVGSVNCIRANVSDENGLLDGGVCERQGFFTENARYTTAHFNCDVGFDAGDKQVNCWFNRDSCKGAPEGMKSMDIEVIASEEPAGPFLKFQDSSGTNVAVIGSNGVMDLRGIKYANGDSFPASTSNDFVVKDSSGENQIILQRSTGNLYAKGVIEASSTLNDLLTDGNKDLLVKNAAGNVVAAFTSTGSVYVSNSIRVNQNP